MHLIQGALINVWKTNQDFMEHMAHLISARIRCEGAYAKGIRICAHPIDTSS